MKRLLFQLLVIVIFSIRVDCSSSDAIKRKVNEDEVPVVTFSSQNGGNATLTVSAGQDFIVQLSDFSSTGFRWFMDSIVPENIATYNSNISGGGVTSPPYVNVSFTAGDSASLSSQGLLTLVHAKPWERDDPDAEKGYARVDLTIETEGAQG